jgi:hypothetical protein
MLLLNVSRRHDKFSFTLSDKWTLSIAPWPKYPARFGEGINLHWGGREKWGAYWWFHV